MRQSLKEALLREYVREALLIEDDFSGMGSDSYTGGMGVGAYGSTEDLKNAFISPFLDVFKTALGKTKEITRKARTLVWVGLQTILTTVCPFWSYTYEDVFEKEKADIEKIRSEYADVYKRTDDALASNDAALLAFMVAPTSFVTAMTAKKGAEASKELLSAVSGGLSDELYDSAKSGLEAAGKWSLSTDFGAGEMSRKSKKKSDGPRSVWNRESYTRLLPLMSEDKEKSDKDKEKSDKGKEKKFGPEDILSDKKFLEKVFNSPKAKQMSATATETYTKTLKNLQDAVSKMHSVSSVDQLESQLMKMKPPKSVKKESVAERFLLEKAETPSKSELKKAFDELKTIKDPKEKKAAEEKLLKGFTTGAGKFFAENLKSDIERLTSAIKAAGGDPESSKMVKDYKALMQKISSS